MPAAGASINSNANGLFSLILSDSITTMPPIAVLSLYSCTLADDAALRFSASPMAIICTGLPSVVMLVFDIIVGNAPVVVTIVTLAIFCA